MSNILDDVKYKYTQNDDSPIDIGPINNHWQKRDRKLRNRKWRELSSKVLHSNKKAF